MYITLTILHIRHCSQLSYHRWFAGDGGGLRTEAGCTQRLLVEGRGERQGSRGVGGMVTTRVKTRFGSPPVVLPCWLSAGVLVWAYPPLLPSLLARFGWSASLPRARFGWLSPTFLVSMNFPLPTRHLPFCYRLPPTLCARRLFLTSLHAPFVCYLFT